MERPLDTTISDCRLVYLALRFGVITWFIAKYTPYVGGSGIPQVIASLSLPHHANKNRLVAFGQTLWKIPLTFLAMLM